MKHSGEKNNFFEVFLEDRLIPDPDILLGRALKYLKNTGRKVSLIGFDETSAPIVNIDEESYIFHKYFGIWEHARFTKTNKRLQTRHLPKERLKLNHTYRYIIHNIN